jgi:hypothetical protein
MLIFKVTSTQESIHIILEIVHVPTSPLAHKDSLWVHKSEESLNKQVGSSKKTYILKVC